jgi:hypothetical protein
MLAQLCALYRSQLTADSLVVAVDTIDGLERAIVVDVVGLSSDSNDQRSLVDDIWHGVLAQKVAVSSRLHIHVFVCNLVYFWIVFSRETTFRCVAKAITSRALRSTTISKSTFRHEVRTTTSVCTASLSIVATMQRTGRVVRR